MRRSVNGRGRKIATERVRSLKGVCRIITPLRTGPLTPNDVYADIYTTPLVNTIHKVQTVVCQPFALRKSLRMSECLSLLVGPTGLGRGYVHASAIHQQKAFCLWWGGKHTLLIIFSKKLEEGCSERRLGSEQRCSTRRIGLLGAAA